MIGAATAGRERGIARSDRPAMHANRDVWVLDVNVIIVILIRTKLLPGQ
jgi:hypothetical protein